MTRKRDNGTGSIYRDATRGGWVGERDIDGKRRRVRGRTKVDTAAKLAQLLRQADDGVKAPNGNTTVDDVLTLWRDRVLPNRNLSPASLDTYGHALRTVSAEFGRVRLQSLTVERVEHGLDHIATGAHGRGKPLAHRTIKYARSTLAQALDAAVNRRWITFNPARQAELTPTAAVADPRRALTPDEAETLWDALEGERLGNLFRLMLTTGLRPGEATGLLSDAVDVDGGVLHVWRAVRRRRGRVELVDYVKTAKSYRTIGLDAPAIEVLRAQRKLVAELKLASRVWATGDQDLIFPTANGLPWDPSNVRDELARICAGAGLWRVRPYELRHSCASILNDRGVPLERIADLLGHVDTTMVSRVYRHRVRPSADAAVGVFDGMFGATRER
jgi:integrase